MIEQNYNKRIVKHRDAFRLSIKRNHSVTALCFEDATPSRCTSNFIEAIRASKPIGWARKAPLPGASTTDRRRWSGNRTTDQENAADLL